ncbi:MAG: hypothetical protein ACR2I0_06875 [Rhodoferax sp.]
MSRSALSTASGLGAAASLALQGLLGLALVRYFPPDAVGVFSAINQVSFFWATLALAQAPLRWLANARNAMPRSMQQTLSEVGTRLAYLAPLVLALLLATRPDDSAAIAIWSLLLALGQIGWQLAQSGALQQAKAWGIFFTRISPHLVVLLGIAAVTALNGVCSTSWLLGLAVAGYAAGALTLHGALRSPPGAALAGPASTQADTRSTALRLLHSAMDAAAMLVLLLVWARSYGDAATGQLGVALRLLGIVPVVVYSDWAQVALAHGHAALRGSLLAALAGVLLTLLAGLGGSAAIAQGLVAPQWQALQDYLVPVMLWQCAACLLAASSHMPFQSDSARFFSYAAIVYDLLLLALTLAPPALALAWSPAQHLWALAGFSTLSLCALAALNYRHWQQAQRARAV